MTQLDALLLLLRATAARGVAAVRSLTRPELALAITLCVCVLVAFMAVGLRPSLGNWSILSATILVTVALLPPVLADAVILRENLKRTHAAMVRTNMAKPTGAPRVAEVTCKHGDHHRFVYGPDGWEAAGPALDRRPEEATAS